VRCSVSSDRRFRRESVVIPEVALAVGSCRTMTPETRVMSGREIIFEITEDEVDGGYSATALGYGIHTQGNSVEELRRNVREAADCYFDEGMPRPRPIRLDFVRNEVLAR